MVGDGVVVRMTKGVRPISRKHGISAANLFLEKEIENKNSVKYEHIGCVQQWMT